MICLFVIIYRGHLLSSRDECCSINVCIGSTRRLVYNCLVYTPLASPVRLSKSSTRKVFPVWIVL